MLGLSSFLTASTAVQSAIGRLLGALGGRSTYTENRKDSRDTIIDISKGDILDKASILLTPTSYSDGKMRSVKSEPTVTHSEDFTTNTTGLPWNTDDAGQLITHVSADNVLRITYNGTTGVGLKRGTTLLNEAGAQYRVTFKARGTRAAAFLSVGSLTDIDNSVDTNPILDTDFQEYEFFVRTDTSPQTLRMYQGTGSAEEYLEITDLLVQDTSSDFTFSRDSSAMRVGPDGLLQDMQDVVGESELILNGDFSDISSNILPNADFSDSSPASQTGLDGGLQFAEWKESAYDDGLKKFEAIEGGIRCTITKQFTDQTWHQRIYQYIGEEGGGILEVGKSFRFRAKFRCSVAQSDFKVAIETTYGGHDQISPQYHSLNAGEWVEADIYFRCTAINDPVYGDDRKMALIFCPDEKIPTGAFYEIKDLSIEKLDPNDRWADYSTPTGQMSITENGLRITTVNEASYSLHRVQNIGHTLVTGKTYRLEYTVSGFSDPDGDIDSFTLWDGDSYGVALETTLGTHVTYFKTATIGVTGVIFNLIAAGSGAGEATDYIELSNVSLKDITLADDLDIPRISYDKDGLNGHILLEPERTNLVPYSENTSGWNRTRSTSAIAPSITAPDGTATTVFLAADDSDNTHNIRTASFTTVADETYTVSIFAKKSTQDWIRLMFQDASTSVYIYAYFDLDNGAIGQTQDTGTNATYVSSTIEDYGNGWYRCSVTGDIGSTTTSYLKVYLAEADEDISFDADGTGVYIWGAQTELGAYPTSYIPTHTGASVTRSEETMAGPRNTSLIDSTEGAQYIEVASIFGEPITSTWKAIAISDGTTANRAWIALDTNGKFSVGSRKGHADDIVPNLSLSSSSAYTSAQLSTFKKVAFRYKDDDWAWYVDGDQIATDTSTDPLWSADTFSEINFDSGGGGSAWKGKIKCLAYFDEILTDDELEALTGDSYNNFGELATANGYTVQ